MFFICSPKENICDKDKETKCFILLRRCLLNVFQIAFGQYCHCQETYLETHLKVYGGAFIANIVNDFQLLTIFATKVPSQMFKWVLNRPWTIISEAYLECSQKYIVEHFCKNVNNF